jgi:uncharacterized membrane protein
LKVSTNILSFIDATESGWSDSVQVGSQILWKQRVSSAAAPVSIVAAYYETPSGASEALNVLRDLHKRHAIEIVDAAVMTRREGSDSLQITETAELSEKKLAVVGAVAGGVLGIIFPPSILALGAVGAAAGAALAHFTDQGFDNNLLKEIGENLPRPAGAALVAVIEEKWLAELSDTLAGYADLERFAMKPEFAARLSHREDA